MKKAMLVLGLGLLGSASAQGLQLSGGAAISTNSSFGLNLGLTFRELTTIGGLPVSGRVSADLGSAYNALNADALFSFASGGGLNLYAGPGLGLGLGGGSNVFASLTAGLRIPVSNQIGAFAEGAFRFGAPSAVRLGLTYVF